MTRTQLETDDDLRRRVEQRVNKRREFSMHAMAFGLIIAVIWLIFLSIPSLLSGAWWIVVATTLGWGAGLAGHAVDTYFQVGAPAERVDEAVWREMRDRFGPDWRETATQAEYEATKFRLSRNVNKIKELLIHGSVFVLINVMIWVLWGVVLAPFFGVDVSRVLVPLLVTLGWGIGMAFHVADVMTTLNRGREVESAVERERDRMARLENTVKRKNDERQTSMHIGDDGELVELIEDDEPTYEKGKRGHI